MQRHTNSRAPDPVTDDVVLRDLTTADLPILFDHQLDPLANHMAAFTTEDPADRDAFTARWTKALGDDRVGVKAIVFGGQVVGHVASFERSGQPEVTYWLGRDYWGKGLATKALSKFLSCHFKTRPLYARAAKDNVASVRVLQKCGFTISGDDKGFSNARGEQVEEFILLLRQD